ncbi:PAS domain-containing protein [Sphingobium chlorophenolicum]|uniref:Putative PAS/PAC sensor protein n=1 Tax=Sphingobium chlorophenolicum TaxID=46429 RepID=A0A081RBV9_SPHCR|nr:PAS domain-containing protein [Sphingobium chlorophenolicum]KEQ52682.1 putative PAS/PAC sensor protein [Sphingobium chlorophenolicum]
MRIPNGTSGGTDNKADDLPPGQVVTATALIRHFAVHSRQALTEPVHILNHGHVGLTLISTESFLRLSGDRNRPDPDHPAAQLDVLLDMIPTQVILADQGLNLLRINLAARKRLEVSEQEVRGAPLSQLLTRPDHHFVLRALERVRDTGVPEEFEQSFTGGPPLVYRIQISAFPGGFAILADEMTDRLSLRAQDARIAAYENLTDGLPGLARGAFNVRGMVTDMSPALADLVGTDESRIVGLRFAALFDGSSRSAISDAVEELLTSGKPFGMAAGLVGSAGSGTVWVGATPLLSADGQAGGVFLIGTNPLCALPGGAPQ